MSQHPSGLYTEPASFYMPLVPSKTLEYRGREPTIDLSWLRTSFSDLVISHPRKTFFRFISKFHLKNRMREHLGGLWSLSLSLSKKRTERGTKRMSVQPKSCKSQVCHSWRPPGRPSSLVTGSGFHADVGMWLDVQRRIIRLFSGTEQRWVAVTTAPLLVHMPSLSPHQTSRENIFSMCRRSQLHRYLHWIVTKKTFALWIFVLLLW